MVPASTVNLVSFVALQTRNSRKADVRQRTGRHDDGPGNDRFTALERDRPDTCLLVPLDARDVAPKPNLRLEAELFHHRSDVAEDLRAGRVGVRPVRVRGETVRVQTGRNVARSSRIRVVAPRPADLRAAFENDEVLDTVLLQPNRRSDSCETSTDDRH